MTATAITLDLGPSRTYAERCCTWRPGPGITGLADGELTVVLARGKRGAVELDTYGVQEQFPPPAPGCREFLLLNQDDAGQPDVYRVVLGTRGATCTCRAGLVARHPCKHKESLIRLVEGGQL